MSERRAISLFEDLPLNGSLVADLRLARPDFSGPSTAVKGRTWASQAIGRGVVLQRSHTDLGQDTALGLLRKRLAEG